MIQGKWVAPGQALDEVSAIRMAVFGRGEDPLDAESWNCLIYQDGHAVAAGRIWWKGDAFWLGEIGVKPEYRGLGLGDLTLRLLLYKAQNHFAREVRLCCPPDVAGFFSRLGFRAVDPSKAESGRTDTSSDDDVAQQSTGQETEMRIAGQDIDLDTCKNCSRINCPSRK